MTVKSQKNLKILFLLACNIKILIEQGKKFCKLTCIINKIEVKIIIINRIIIIIGEKIAIIIYN